MPRSLRLREDCIERVKFSLLRNGFPSQKILAANVGLSQSTISQFLNGKPVDYDNFFELCRALGQEWRDIADLERGSEKDLEVAAPVATTEIAKSVILSIGDRSNGRVLANQLRVAFDRAGIRAILIQPNVLPKVALENSDYFLLLLSPETIASERVLEEVRQIREWQQSDRKAPTLLPICTDWTAATRPNFDLQQLLQDVQPWQWERDRDPEILAEALLAVVRERRTSLPANHDLAFRWADLTGGFSTEMPPEGSVERSVEMRHERDRSGNRFETFPLPAASPEIPGGQMPLESAFYVDRPPIEARCYEAIVLPGALVRIKAPRQMGKTSLMARLLQQAERHGSRTVALSLQLANRRAFRDTDTFLQWVCASIALDLGLLDPEQLANHWQLAAIVGSSQTCKAYLEQYLLPALQAPLTLGLDEVDEIFPHEEIASDFFGLLRALHEEAKRRDLWKNLRVVVVHSTEAYIPLDTNKSPFNVGLAVELPDFTAERVGELVHRHGLNWSATEIEELMSVVGGHPFLVRLGLYCIARGEIGLAQLVRDAATEAGPYGDHLRRHWWNLEKYPPLLEAMQRAVATTDWLRLPSEQAFKLNGMGLVRLQGDRVRPRYPLYEAYFRNQAFAPDSFAPSEEV